MATAHRRRSRLVVVVVVLLVIGCPLGAPGATAASDDAGADPVGVWPLRPVPEVVAHFDPPDTPYGAGHRGVDLAGRPGQRVRTALPGVVGYAGMVAGKPVVVVSHGPTRTTYEPVRATVSVGDPVSAGDPIGRLELSGSHCLPRACLHWGWLRGDVYLDPLRLVGMGPVRLLPLWREEPVLGRRGPERAAVVPGKAEEGRRPLSGAGRRPTTTQPGAASGRSGAGVGLVVGLTQPVGGDVGVALGGGQ